MSYTHLGPRPTTINQLEENSSPNHKNNEDPNGPER
jgi:hypothetical protein